MEKLRKFGILRPAEGTEGKESLELFRASLGFDFIFTHDADGTLRCKCIEINGHDSGVSGVRDVPRDQIDKTAHILGDVRAAPDTDVAWKYKKMRRVIEDIRVGKLNPSNEAMQKMNHYMKGTMQKEPLFKHAYHNPTFVENITRDKRVQGEYIPDAYRPHTWHVGEDPVSPTGGWIFKHFDSRGGENVFVVPNAAMETAVSALEDKVDEFVVQEYVPSSGAQMAPKTADRRAAAMRLLMDFRYLSDGRIVPDFVTGYQRVAPYDFDQETDADGEQLSHEDVLVVNKHRGATSAGVSPEEMSMARVAAEEIIRNIGMAYKERVATDVAMAG